MQRRRKAKRTVAMAKKEGTATLYEELDTREGEVKIHEDTELRRQGREKEKGQVIST